MPVAYGSLAQHRDRLGLANTASTAQATWLELDGGVEEAYLGHLIEWLGPSLERLTVRNFRVWWRQQMTPRILMQLLVGCPRLRVLDIKITINGSQEEQLRGAWSSQVLAKVEALTIELESTTHEGATNCKFIRSLLQLVGRHLKALKISVAGDLWPIDAIVAVAIVEFCPNLVSLGLGLVTDAFLHAFIQSYERESSPCRVTSLTLRYVHFANAASPVVVALTSPQSRIGQRLQRLCVARFVKTRYGGEDEMEKVAASLHEINAHNTTLTEINSDGWNLMSPQHLPMVSACPPITRRLAFLSAMRRANRAELPRSSMQLIFDFMGTRRVRRLINWIHGHD